jgi:carboxymethylenebutenolidase
MGEDIRLGTDGAGGRVLKPIGQARNNPAVVLLPAIAGINDYIERVATRLVREGYVVLTVDYFSRDGGPPDLSTPEKIMAAVSSLPDEQVAADVHAAVDHLARERDVSRIGVLGFCIGGSLAILTASQLEGLGCAVAFYGVLRYGELTKNKPLSPLDAAEQLGVPLLGHWGDADHLVPEDDVAELRKRLSGKPAEIRIYPGAGHAFHEDHRDVYRPVAAAEAWQRSLRYFDWYLRSQADD